MDLVEPCQVTKPQQKGRVSRYPGSPRIPSLLTCGQTRSDLTPFISWRAGMHVSMYVCVCTCVCTHTHICNLSYVENNSSLGKLSFCRILRLHRHTGSHVHTYIFWSSLLTSLRKQVRWCQRKHDLPRNPFGLLQNNIFMNPAIIQLLGVL